MRKYNKINVFVHGGDQALLENKIGENFSEEERLKLKTASVKKERLLKRLEETEEGNLSIVIADHEKELSTEDVLDLIEKAKGRVLLIANASKKDCPENLETFQAFHSLQRDIDDILNLIDSVLKYEDQESKKK